MFKHILLPIDGSELSEAVIQKGIQFAKSINAEVTGFHVILPFHVLSLRTGILEEVRPSNAWASLKRWRKRRA